MQAAIGAEGLSEEMRVLYVALTRAKDRLILTAAAKDPARLLERLAAQLPRRAAPGNTCCSAAKARRNGCCWPRCPTPLQALCGRRWPPRCGPRRAMRPDGWR